MRRVFFRKEQIEFSVKILRGMNFHFHLARPQIIRKQGDPLLDLPVIARIAYIFDKIVLKPFPRLTIYLIPGKNIIDLL